MNPERSSPPLKEALDSFNRKWLAFHSYPDDLTLYHYTTLDGLMGIIDTRSLWCSHVRTLNDPSEIQYGKKLVTDQMDKYIIDIKDKVIIDLFEQLKMLTSGFEILFHIFVGCFCQNNNLLSQWRNYSAQGGGYNVGIKFNSNTKYSHYKEDLTNASHVILRKINYSPASQNHYIKLCLDSIAQGCIDSLKWFTKTGIGIPQDWSLIAANEAINILFDIILSFKDPVFSEENEWRIIKVVRDDKRPDLYKFRNDKNRLIPFLVTYIYNSIGKASIFPLASVTFGPMLEKEITESMLKLLLINSSKNSFNKYIEFNPGLVVLNSAGFNIRL